MHFPNVTISVPLRFALLALFCLFGLLNAAALQATEDSPSAPPPGTGVEFPAMFGEIVYQTEAAASNIYIIANGHRSAIQGANAAEILQAQIETFRIGEWLINQNRIELVLPEGFFGEMDKACAGGAGTDLLDGQMLQDALADSSLFVNAELLLHENYGIRLNQIENRTLYRQARERLRASLKPGARLSPTLNRELTYLQRLRTANILQQAPAVIATAYQQGRITAPNAMLTIGLSHLKDIIAFLEAGEINMDGLHTTTRDFPAQEKALDLLRKEVSVTVIVPRTLIGRRIRG